MKRRGLLAFGVALVAALTMVSVAIAGNAHFIGSPTCTTTSTTVTCTGSVAGLGNGDIVVSISASAEASFNCVNKGGTIAPGQNKVLFTAGGSVTIPENEAKNGRVNFSVTAPLATPTATPEQAGCPNGRNWSTQIASIEFGNVLLTIQQPPGTTVLSTTVTPS